MLREFLSGPRNRILSAPTHPRRLRPSRVAAVLATVGGLTVVLVALAAVMASRSLAWAPAWALLAVAATVPLVVVVIWLVDLACGRR
jgi:hypothetical protein